MGASGQSPSSNEPVAPEYSDAVEVEGRHGMMGSLAKQIFTCSGGMEA